MRQSLFVIVLTAALAACTKEATAPTLATLVGTISVEYSGFGAMSCPAQFGADVVTLKPST